MAKTGCGKLVRLVQTSSTKDDASKPAIAKAVSAVGSRQAKQERLKKRGISKHELGRKWKAVPWDRVLEREETAPYYFMRSGLIRKDLIPLYAGSKYMPMTHTCENYDELCEAIEDEPDVEAWVLKFPDSSNAFGMKFFKEAEEVAEDFEYSEARVVQRYVPPLLLNERKFHIRALVLCRGDLEVLLYKETRVLIATEVLDMADLENDFMHITNRSHNYKHPDFDEAKQNVRLDLPPPKCNEKGGRGGGGQELRRVVQWLQRRRMPLWNHLTRHI
jgi:hypothetical protein